MASPILLARFPCVKHITKLDGSVNEAGRAPPAVVNAGWPWTGCPCSPSDAPLRFEAVAGSPIYPGNGKPAA